MEKPSYDILSVLERATIKKRHGERVISACAGMLYHEDKSLCTYTTLNSQIKKNFIYYLSYPPVLGTYEYKEGVLNWIFRSNLDEIKALYDIPFCATVGGTGACYFAFRHENKVNQGAGLISDIYWPNYDGIAKEAGLKLSYYKMYDDKYRMNFDSLKLKLDTLLLTYPSVLLIINDPCHNPTGFCMNKEEYIKIFELLNSYNGKVKLFLDIAYFDYAPQGFLFKEVLLNYKIHFNVTLAFSCSKSFGYYGGRLGAIFDLIYKERKTSSNKSKKATDLEKYYYKLARSTYSCPNYSIMGPLSEILNTPNKAFKLRKEINRECKRLEQVGKKFISLLSKLKIKHLPYHGGFYLIMLVNDAYDFCEKLEKKNIFFVPIDNNKIRVALSGLSISDVDELEQRLA